MLERLRRLAAVARESGATVVHLLYSPMAGDRSQNRRSVLFAKTLHRQDHWRADGPECQPVAALGVAPSDLLIVRHSGLAPTHGTETFRILRNIGIDAIVLGGVSTNIALPLVAVDAVDQDFSVVIPRDATAGTPLAHHESMLMHTLPFVATISTCEEVTAVLRGA